MMDNLILHKNKFSIFLVWLFHVSALVGITLGQQEWFVTKTPLNLTVMLLLFLWVYPMDTKKKYGAFLLFMMLGMFAEWIGVHYGVLFGSYAYGANFGPKLDGIPYLIGVNWALLTFATAAITKKIVATSIAKVILASLLMLVLDFLMEHTAPLFDFWTFEGGLAGWWNYICWFLLAAILQLMLHLFKITGNFRFSLHLYLAQCVFFGYLYWYL